MDAYIVIKRVMVEKANAIQCDYIIGTPAMTQFAGYFNKINRDLSAIDKSFKLKGFAVSYHNYSFNSFSSDYGIRKFNIKAKLKDKRGESKSSVQDIKGEALLDDPLVDFEASFLIKCSFDIDTEKLITHLDECIRANRICCGNFVKYNTYSEPFYVFDTANCEENKVLNHLMPGNILIDRHKLVEKECLENNISPLEAMANFLKVYPFVQEKDGNEEKLVLVEDIEKETRPIVYRRKTTGWFVPMMIGYANICRKDNVTHKRSSDCEHHFVEPITTLCEYKMPNKFSTVENILWHNTYDKENELYLIVNDGGMN